ncbi:hypothetical protein NDU88_005539 [Pleurodeles waltl]|uniref:Uncharacterized protein n=1 Tax=Pleurodeles waltl TaxID=8319 RepID=A0AAV7QI52_PLEWA|nr:hypothetical protein NDU88_005539 [Pleurodeles waltl]
MGTSRISQIFRFKDLIVNGALLAIGSVPETTKKQDGEKKLEAEETQGNEERATKKQMASARICFYSGKQEVT